jgi:RimK-like ATP-grasp domain
MIVVCGSLTDIVTELLCARLEKLRYDYKLIDMGVYPDGYHVKWNWDQEIRTGSITGTDWHVELEEITGVFARYVGERARKGRTTLTGDLVDAGAFELQAGLMNMWEHLTCPVANRIAGALSNHSKPYQLLVIRQTALRIPETLVTSDPDAALAFYEECAGRVIFKSVSGIRSVVRCMERSDLERLSYLRNGPAQFQAFVPGDNVRVHTVGEEVFATRIHSAAVDYRYAHQQGANVEMEPTKLPAAVTNACVDLARAMDLTIAGIDLKVTPRGEWYCFEVNPSPGFAYYEQHTGQPISAALAETLRRGPSIPRPNEGDCL